MQKLLKILIYFKNSLKTRRKHALEPLKPSKTTKGCPILAPKAYFLVLCFSTYVPPLCPKVRGEGKPYPVLLIVLVYNNYPTNTIIKK